jgi:hypothetical protein
MDDKFEQLAAKLDAFGERLAGIERSLGLLTKQYLPQFENAERERVKKLLEEVERLERECEEKRLKLERLDDAIKPTAATAVSGAPQQQKLLAAAGGGNASGSGRPNNAGGIDKSRPVSCNAVAGTPWSVVWTGDNRVFFHFTLSFDGC